MFYKPFEKEPNKLSGKEIFKVASGFASSKYVIFFSLYCGLYRDFKTNKLKTKNTRVVGHPFPYGLLRSFITSSPLICGTHGDLEAVFEVDLVLLSKDEKFFKLRNVSKE